jgi:penicillin-binding protein-related factor A (putative recombinase)
MRGRALELAVARQATAYYREGRCVLARQYPRTATGAHAAVVYVGDAPIDFLGVMAPATPLAVECKETSEHSFPIEKLEEDQRNALDAFARFGGRTLVLIDFEKHGECYSIEWHHIRDFIAAPWRKSLSLAWCRAFGMLVPTTPRDADDWKVMFLDGVPHPAQLEAHIEVARERHGAPIVSLEPAEKPQPRTAGAEKMTIEERMQRIRAATEEGIVNATKKASRPKWAPRRGGARR